MKKYLMPLWVVSLFLGACGSSDNGSAGGNAGSPGSVGGSGASEAGGMTASAAGSVAAATAGSGGAAGTYAGAASGAAGAASGAAGATGGIGGAAGATGGTGGAVVGTGGAAGSVGHGGNGGAGGNSGAGGGAGNGAGGTGGASASNCAAVPVSPNATASTRNVLCYLYSQYGNHIISGQEEGGTDLEIDYIHTSTGKYPAIRSFEANSDGAATRCVSYWNAGGLCMFGYHMGAPSTADGYTGSMTAVTGGINSVLTVGSANNTVFNQRLDALANRLLTVQAAGGTVIFRPFHEAGGTWFWWSMEGGAQYVRLWKYAFDRITNTDGVKNAIWLVADDGTPQSSFDPGTGYRDIGGADNYNKAFDYSPMTSIYTAATKVFGSVMPIALHECGPVPDPDTLQSTKSNWLFFSIWTQPYPEQYSTVVELQKVYSSSYVVSRDGLPHFN